MSKTLELPLSNSIDFNSQENVCLSKRKRNVTLDSLAKKVVPTLSNESRESSINT